MKRLKISIDRGGLSGSAYQISLSVLDENGNGHGYRLLGPKYLGNSTLVTQAELSERDADEIRALLDEVFPPAVSS